MEADWAESEELGRSVGCIHVFHDGDLLELSAVIQQSSALSSTGNTLDGSTADVGDSQIEEAMKEMQHDLKLRILSDLIAALVMVQRLGGGHMESVQAESLLIQNMLRQKYLEMGIIVETSHGTENVERKFHPEDGFVELLRLVPEAVGGSKQRPHHIQACGGPCGFVWMDVVRPGTVTTARHKATGSTCTALDGIP